MGAADQAMAIQGPEEARAAENNAPKVVYLCTQAAPIHHRTGHRHRWLAHDAVSRHDTSSTVSTRTADGLWTS